MDNACNGDPAPERRDVLKIKIALPDKQIEGVLETLTSCPNYYLVIWDVISVSPELIFSFNWR